MFKIKVVRYPQTKTPINFKLKFFLCLNNKTSKIIFFILQL